MSSCGSAFTVSRSETLKTLDHELEHIETPRIYSIELTKLQPLQFDNPISHDPITVLFQLI